MRIEQQLRGTQRKHACVINGDILEQRNRPGSARHIEQVKLRGLHTANTLCPSAGELYCAGAAERSSAAVVFPVTLQLQRTIVGEGAAAFELHASLYRDNGARGNGDAAFIVQG